MTTEPAPLRRRGPRPLTLHLSLGAMRALAAAGSAPLAATAMPGSATPSAPGSRSWNDAFRISKAGQAEAARIAQALAAGGHSPEAFSAAVLRRLARADRAMLAGLAAYRRHPYRRQMADPPVLWAEGGSRLLDYGGQGPAVLFVPSLVNRAHVLDLMPRHSMLRFLAGEGLRILLLDWGWPGEVERRFTLTDYIAGRLERALAAAPGPLVLVGYCMGGLLALAAALRRPDRVRGLALLATPWDFHAGDGAVDRAGLAAAVLPGLEPVLEGMGALPVDVIQTLFAMLDPWGIPQKFRAFARLDPESDRALHFVALEDWLNDGVPLAAPVARECLGGWYGRNEPRRRAWRVAGLAVDPRELTMPAFLAVPHRDRIVPPASATALAAELPRVTVHDAPSGHIGMAAGSGAEHALWRPLLGWLRGL